MKSRSTRSSRSRRWRLAAAFSARRSRSTALRSKGERGRRIHPDRRVAAVCKSEGGWGLGGTINRAAASDTRRRNWRHTVLALIEHRRQPSAAALADPTARQPGCCGSVVRAAGHGSRALRSPSGRSGRAPASHGVLAAVGGADRRCRCALGLAAPISIMVRVSMGRSAVFIKCGSARAPRKGRHPGGRQDRHADRRQARSRGVKASAGRQQKGESQVRGRSRAWQRASPGGGDRARGGGSQCRAWPRRGLRERLGQGRDRNG